MLTDDKYGNVAGDVGMVCDENAKESGDEEEDVEAKEGATA